MNIENSTVFVTGANRGIGYALACSFIEHGAAKVYAGARDPNSITDPRLTPIKLDVTDIDDIKRSREKAADTTILVNNAGVFRAASPLNALLNNAREEIEVNYLGAWSMAQAFTPIIKQNGGGKIVNMLSVASWRG